MSELPVVVIASKDGIDVIAPIPHECPYCGELTTMYKQVYKQKPQCWHCYEKGAA